jgi:hypothetical protein
MKKPSNQHSRQVKRPRKTSCGEEFLAADAPVLAGKLAPNEAPGKAFLVSSPELVGSGLKSYRRVA